MSKRVAKGRARTRPPDTYFVLATQFMLSNCIFDTYFRSYIAKGYNYLSHLHLFGYHIPQKYIFTFAQTECSASRPSTICQRKRRFLPITNPVSTCTGSLHIIGTKEQPISQDDWENHLEDDACHWSLHLHGFALLVCAKAFAVGFIRRHVTLGKNLDTYTTIAKLDGRDVPGDYSRLVGGVKCLGVRWEKFESLCLVSGMLDVRLTRIPRLTTEPSHNCKHT